MEEQYSLRQLFPELEEELYKEIEQHGEIREMPAGTVLLKKGQTIRYTMLILKGIVKLYQEDDEGNEFFMYDIEPGEACAISMVCTYRQENSQVLAKAMTDVSVLIIPLEYMDEWLGKYKSWHYFVIRTWRARYEDLLHTVNAIAFKKMDERLEHYIKERVRTMGRHIKLTHQEIAADLNSSREVISRLMKKMEKDGWIIIHRNAFEWIR
ncbi:Crp/Fnr family transcriptional regulator [Chitinophaga sancti]|uniref:Crp/Fnr family transcriptional regulator n=1 Tax=Chitinophaga sancti TaxID=1004 RepID=A0A1K1MUR9_9BACT|nr:Crp/Fnr family transcriptional regulator [Chitinophaga sancti]WQD63010.1 Crp/Fnr family transcriptional regulator [Chitinophaga sancti]WQG91365.1 Crp/Fnr family transcriptional regulator [Chitinophaga sancti]SFW26904.1 CRP/FNR family transcriptional regulator, anaerobic regulatory protein [Chitinophaga sancti]